MHSIRTQEGPLMNRLTFPCLSAVVFSPPSGYVACFILSGLKCFKTKKNKERTWKFTIPVIFSQAALKAICASLQQSFEKVSFSWNLWIFLLKNAKKKFSICSFGRMTFLSQLVTFIREKSTSLWRALNGQTQCHKRHHWKKHHGKHTTCELWLHRARASVDYSTFQWTWRFIEGQ